MKKLSHILIGIGLVVGIVVMAPQAVHAEGLVNCGNGTVENGRISDACTVQDLFTTVVTVTNFLIAFAGLVAILVIARAGLNMVTSAGSPAGYAAAKKLMTNAILGLLLVLLAFMLVNTLLSDRLGIGIQGGANIFKDAVKFIQG